MIEGQRGCGVKFNKRKAPNKRNTKRPATNHQQDGWEYNGSTEIQNRRKKSQLKRKKAKEIHGNDGGEMFGVFYAF